MIILFYKSLVLRLWASRPNALALRRSRHCGGGGRELRNHPRRRPYHPQLRRVGRLVHHAVQDGRGLLGALHQHAIMCVMPACMQCAGVSAAMDRSLNIWKLGLDIRLYSVLYIVISQTSDRSILSSYKLHPPRKKMQGSWGLARIGFIMHPGVRAAICGLGWE
jgi:hypothetical protein